MRAKLFLGRRVKSARVVAESWWAGDEKRPQAPGILAATGAPFAPPTQQVDGRFGAWGSCWLPWNLDWVPQVPRRAWWACLSGWLVGGRSGPGPWGKTRHQVPEVTGSLSTQNPSLNSPRPKILGRHTQTMRYRYLSPPVTPAVEDS